MASSIRYKVENREKIGNVLISKHMQLVDIAFSLDFPYAVTCFVTRGGSVTILTIEDTLDIIGFLEIIEHNAVLL